MTGSCHTLKESSSVRNHVHELAVLGAARVEFDLAVDQREQRVVAAQADAVAGVEAGAALTHDDVAGFDRLAAVALDAQVFRTGTAAVLTGTYPLVMCHGCVLLA